MLVWALVRHGQLPDREEWGMDAVGWALDFLVIVLYDTSFEKDE